ncbi:WhiB family transcriptional regulator [Actinomadura xylanilytica]|uniref:WhiB family transcriptional regulator n=1 Tax=Actinomadura xylanilytica TaxID=887459 RepID=UPI00255AFB51|nr:WhiB family transcriptional regulator [Actinomadura xylanilytica]MDL4772491.1 WhiB family transcriptional regulator [Actinomadura xylanilytica]
MSARMTVFESLPAVDLRGMPIEGAQCRFDPELHDCPAQESPDERAAREVVAAEVCASCPLRDGCLNFALRILPTYGVWAGFTADEIAELSALDMGEVA